MWFLFRVVFQFNEAIVLGFTKSSFLIQLSKMVSTRPIWSFSFLLGTLSQEVCVPITLAAATSCVLDQFDRPIVGAINFCLGELNRRLEEEEHSHLPKVLMSNLILESNVERE
jgi:hypothetical protein